MHADDLKNFAMGRGWAKGVAIRPALGTQMNAGICWGGHYRIGEGLGPFAES